MALARAHPFDPDAPAAEIRPLAQPRFVPGRPLQRPRARCARLLHASRSHQNRRRSQEVFPKREKRFPEETSKYPEQSFFRS